MGICPSYARRTCLCTHNPAAHVHTLVFRKAWHVFTLPHSACPLTHLNAQVATAAEGDVIHDPIYEMSVRACLRACGCPSMPACALPSARPPARPPARPSVSQSVSPSVRPSVRPSIHMSVCELLHPVVRPSAFHLCRSSVHRSPSVHDPGRTLVRACVHSRVYSCVDAGLRAANRVFPSLPCPNACLNAARCACQCTFLRMHVYVHTHAHDMSTRKGGLCTGT